MKSYSKFIQLIALPGVIYFLLAGVGHNIVDYCCDSCESAGIEYVSHHSCHDLHHPDHAVLGSISDFKTPEVHESSSCCSHTDSATTAYQFNWILSGTCSMSADSCELQRLELDDFQVTVAPKLHVEISIVKLPVAVLSTELLSCVQSELFLHYPPPEPLFRMGRSLLALKSVLVI